MSNRLVTTPVLLSKKLAGILGAEQLTRPQVTSALWRYIKENGLQDKDVKSVIRLNAVLEDIFATKGTIKHTDILRLVQPHLTKTAVASEAKKQELQ